MLTAVSVPSDLPVDVQQRAARVTLLVLDVDGVLTDGRIIYDEFGDELKHFDVQDGAGLVLWQRAGLRSAIISARKSKLVKRRAKEMRIDVLAQNAADKLQVYEGLLTRFRLPQEQVCAMGDDVMDLPMLHRAGLAIAVPNAIEDVKTASHYITHRPGGRGAVREVIDLILKAKGLWEGIVKSYQA